MCCEDKEDQKSWMNEIKTIIMRPLDPQESEGEICVELFCACRCVSLRSISMSVETDVFSS